MDVLEKIKSISKINIKGICKDLKINRSNLLNGRSSNENEQKVYKEIKDRYEKIINS